MKKVIFLILFTSTTVFAQTVTKNPGDFTTVKVFDRITAELFSSKETKVEITGTRASEVEVVNNNGDLKIRMPFPKLLKGEAIQVRVYYKKLEGVEASEGAIVSSAQPISAIHFNVNVKEGASVDLALETQKTTTKAASGGIVRLAGISQNQEVVLTGGAMFKAKDFETKQTTITLNAGGEATIFATDYVNAKVRAGGDISIYGSPKQLDQKTVIAGSIKEIK